MSLHSPNNSQCDLNMYGPDPGDGSVKCTCDEDAPVEPATTPRQGPPSRAHWMQPLESGPGVAALVGKVEGPQHPHFGAGPHVVTLTGRAAASHAELREAGRELRAAQDLYRKAEARWKAALDAHMQEIQ